MNAEHNPDTDKRIRETLSAVADTCEPQENWDGIVTRATDAGPNRDEKQSSSPPIWMAVAAGVVLVALVGFLTLRSEPRTHRVDTADEPHPDDAAQPDDPLRVRFGVDIETLPQQGLLVRTTSGAVELLTLDGEVLSSAEDALFDPGSIGPVPYRVEIQPDAGDVVAVTSQAWSTEPPLEGCEQPEGYALAPSIEVHGVRVAVCGSPKPQEIRRVLPDGTDTVLSGAPSEWVAVNGVVPGHWDSVELSPDTQWLLAQWSGECEIPVAYLINTDTGATTPAVTRATTEIEPTRMVGWTSDGTAIIETAPGGCGGGSGPPGVFAINPDTPDEANLISDDVQLGMVWMWAKNDRDRSERASEVLAAADRQWSPDLDGDGDADVVALVGDEVLFLLRTEQGNVPVSDAQGEEIKVQISEQVSFTCEEDGLWTQTFDSPVDATGRAPLQLSRLDLDGTVGSWTPNPSFLFGPDFELPELGKGCPP